ncbi:hypothetical protein HAZT_HAZT001084 [Hyalella azteca]|uniref:Uncharacterized protein n=1 Tax=Hyalella azteca TaxID=294128 RepID=A0A6A0H6I2_HYAAZ|nr:hypothetical protein HAZT_HAZT001084 [Hyalella azteca]
MEEEEEEKIMPLRPDLQGPLDQVSWSPGPWSTLDSKAIIETLVYGTRFGTVEGFWRCYQWLKRPSYLSLQSIYHLFKEGIKPMWEFPSNINGGTWKLWVRKGVIDRCWENLLLAVVGEQFDVGDEICGIVVCVRNQEDTLSIWNKTASDQRLVEGIRKKLVEVLQLPSNTLMEYKSHTQAMKETFPGHKTFPQKHL